MRRAYIYTAWERGILAAAAKGLEALGYSPVFRNHRYWNKDCLCRDAELVVVYGMQTTCPAILEAYQSIGVPVIVIDAGYYRRDLGYQQIGLGGLNVLPVGDAGIDRAEAIGLIAAAKRGGDPKGYPLVLAQKPGDAQHNIDVQAWLREVMEQYPDAVVRQHPQVVRTQESLEEQLAGASMVITHNSTAAYAAFVAGVPVLCDDAAIYAEVARASFPEKPDGDPQNIEAVQAFLNRVAYGQWTEEEVAAGTPFHVLGFGEAPVEIPTPPPTVESIDIEGGATQQLSADTPEAGDNELDTPSIEPATAAEQPKPKRRAKR